MVIRVSIINFINKNNFMVIIEAVQVRYPLSLVSEGEREGESETGREGEREEESEGGREGESEGGREGERVGERAEW